MNHLKYLFVALLLTMPLTACANENTTGNTPVPTQKIEETDSNKGTLLDTWSSYLSVKNQIYEAENWVLDYVDAYLDTMEWKDLKAARAACSAAKEKLFEVETSFSLDAQVKSALQGQGIETDYIDLQFEQVETDANDASVTLDTIEVYLESCAMFERGASLMKDYVQTLRRINALLGKYERQTTNYLLVNAAVSSHEAYWKNMETLYPALCLEHADYYDVQEDIERYGELVINELNGLFSLDHLNALDDEYSRVLSGETSGLSVLHAPKGLPLPEGLGPYDAIAYRMLTNDSSDVEFIPYGEDMKNTPYDTGAYFEHLDPQQLQSYLDLLGNVTQIGDASWKSQRDGYAVDIYDTETDTIVLFEEEDMTFLLD